MKRVPRILKINEVSYPIIYCVFRNGEHRKVNIKTLFKRIKVKEEDFGFEIIDDQRLFETVVLKNHTLAWPKLKKSFTISKGKKITVPFELDPITLFEYSKLDDKYSGSFNLGDSLKEMRKRLKLTQDSLAENIGTSKQYISRIENGSDLEYKTLKKIYELGFDKHICVASYSKEDTLKSFSNSILTIKFIEWIAKNKSNLILVEGIGPDVEALLHRANISTIDDLAGLNFKALFEILKNDKAVKNYHSPDTWIVQAMYILGENWVSLIQLQKLLHTRMKKTGNSKLEVMARKELKDNIFSI